MQSAEKQPLADVDLLRIIASRERVIRVGPTLGEITTASGRAARNQPTIFYRVRRLRQLGMIEARSDSRAGVVLSETGRKALEDVALRK